MIFTVRILEHVLFVVLKRQLIVAVQVYVRQERILIEVDLVKILAHTIAV